MSAEADGAAEREEKFLSNYKGVFRPEIASAYSEACREIDARYGREHSDLAEQQKRIAFNRIMRR